jgi:hypothetical protein
MTKATESPKSVKPMMLPRSRGGWLAISQPGDSLQIGAVGASEKEAKEAFATACEEWAQLLAHAE